MNSFTPNVSARSQLLCMRFVIFAVLTLVVLGLCSCGDDTVNSDGTASISWQSLNSIYASGANKKPLSMIYVYRNSCSYCQRMNTETLVDPAVVNVLDQYYNAAKLDTEDASVMVTVGGVTMSAQELASSYYGINGVPTVIVLEKDGSYLTRMVGFRAAAKFQQELESLALTL